MFQLPPNRELSGRRLNRLWRVGVKHALYDREGTWWEILKRFPGALFDPWGYVLYETEEGYRNLKYLNIGSKTNLSYRADHISEIPDYRRMRDGEWWKQ